MAGLKSEILMVGEDIRQMAEVSNQLDRASYAISIAQTPRPVDYLLERHSRPPGGAIVRLKGTENVADLRAVFAAYDGSTFVFLAASFPPRPAVARIVEQSGSAILSASESSLTVVATLLALLFQRKVT
jgi:hypothetical protein